MPEIQHPGRDRRQPLYGTDERAVIDIHKAQYLKASSPAERKQIAKNVLAALFNHWSEKGINITDHDDRTKVFAFAIGTRAPHLRVLKALVKWMQNNWRLSGISQTESSPISIKRTEVLWRSRREDVFAEIATLLGVESADTNTPGWFHKRMPALGNILRRMTTAEKEELDRERDRMVKEGHTEEDRRRSVPIGAGAGAE